ncbi:MAG: hypothetical protein VX409_02025 [Verrucomicrobiota bacterium]|nr:hypothetical protein [Verrucomicrobiota bacterium]
MKGNGLLIFAIIAVVSGASSVIYFSQAITKKNTTIESKEKKITELTAAKTTLETKSQELTEKLKTANTKVATTQDRLLKVEKELNLNLTEYSSFQKQAADALAAKDEKIMALNKDLQTAQNKNKDYDSQIKTLNTQIVSKDEEITAIERRLEASEADREYLLKQRDKLIAEKAELEKQFQDIAVLRQKVLKLQGELMASKKLEWIRRGLYGSARRKGGSKLMSISERKPKQESTKKTDLNVEIKSDGTVKIAPQATKAEPNATTP